MNDNTKSVRTRQRAARLRQEAGNCVSTAVQMSGSAHAAALIDEAVKLARRSQELASGETAASPDRG